MKILLNEYDMVAHWKSSMFYVKVVNGQWVPCEESEKEAVLLSGLNTTFDKNHTIVEVESVPEDITPYLYKYVNGHFILNPEYVVPDDLKNQIIDEYTLQLIEEGVI